MPESLDLDALREAVAWFATQRHPSPPGELKRATIVSQVYAVLALVEEQRERIAELEITAKYLRRDLDGCSCYLDRALAGSPAENKEPS